VFEIQYIRVETDELEIIMIDELDDEVVELEVLEMVIIDEGLHDELLNLNMVELDEMVKVVVVEIDLVLQWSFDDDDEVDYQLEVMIIYDEMV
jgi:hypothetical protein